MKKHYLLLLFILFASRLFASHLIGGELRYDFNGTNYSVSMIMYMNCAGIPPSSSMEIDYASTAYGASSRAVSLTRVDTLSGIYCPGAGANCSGTSGYLLYLKCTYTDTITLPPASDWIISTNNAALIASIANLSSPGSHNLYLSAGLDNSSAENNSAVIANNPPFFISRNTVNTITLDPVDADDDSVVCQMVQPRDGSGTSSSPIPYASGYSLTYPLGTGTSTSIYGIDHWLYITTNSTLGQFELAMKTLEYRHHSLIGYTTRQWMSITTSSPVPKPPYLYTEYTYPAVPGRTDSAIVQFLDSTTTDSIFVDFATTNSWSYTITKSPSTGFCEGKIKWTTPSTVSPSTYPFFYIYARAYDHSCPYAAETWIPLCIHVVYPNDSVWPGDANADHIVNVYDALAVAVAYGKTGPSRPSASTTWVSQYCAPWSYTFSSGINMNNADCNGDGVVNLSDLGAIISNYGLTHPRGGWSSGAKMVGLPDLYFDLTGIKLTPRANVTIPIVLGNSTVPVSKVYGVAGSALVSGIVPSTDATIASPATTWMGTSANTLSLNKSINANKTDFAYAKTDHVNAAGQGIIATISLTVPSTAAIGTQVILSFTNMKFIDSAGNPIDSLFNVLSDTSSVTTDIPNVSNIIASAAVVPNPSTTSAQIKLSLETDATLQLSITDIVGKTVWSLSGNYRSGIQNIAIPSSSLAPGMYMVQIEGDGWKYPVIKWVKE